MQDRACVAQRRGDCGGLLKVSASDFGANPHERGGVVSITRIEVELNDGLVTVTVTAQASGASFRELFTKCSMR